MQDRPDAHELLSALAGYLSEELLPDVAEHHRFGIRVAANVCAMLARELESGAPDRTEQRRLARAIRRGRHDHELAQLAAAQRDEVRAKLRIAHPGWEDG